MKNHQITYYFGTSNQKKLVLGVCQLISCTFRVIGNYNIADSFNVIQIVFLFEAALVCCNLLFLSKIVCQSCGYRRNHYSYYRD